MRLRKKIKRKFELWLIEGLLLLAKVLPRGTGLRIFDALGGLAGRVLERDRRRAMENLAVAFPDAPEMVRGAMVRGMFRTLGRNAFDFLRFASAQPRRVEELVADVDGERHLLDAYEVGRGVIVITGHIGCWELMPAYYGSRGFRSSVIGRRMKVSRLNDRLTQVRARFSVKTIDRDSSPREPVSALKRGELLGVLIDQHTSVAGVYVPFFDKPAFTPSGVAKLALMTRAPIVPMATFRVANDRHRIVVMPPVDMPEEALPRKEAVYQLTARCSQAIEDLIRIDPKQWVWFHRRWRDPEPDDVVEAAYAARN